MKNILRLIYSKYKKEFSEIIIEDMIGEIPAVITEPNTEFLSRSGRKMEQWLLWQSWIIQRKSASQPHLTDFYSGVLFQIKLMLMISTKKSSKLGQLEVAKEEKPKRDDIGEVNQFLQGLKKK